MTVETLLMFIQETLDLQARLPGLHWGAALSIREESSNALLADFADVLARNCPTLLQIVRHSRQMDSRYGARALVMTAHAASAKTGPRHPITACTVSGSGEC